MEGQSELISIVDYSIVCGCIVITFKKKAKTCRDKLYNE